MQALGLVFMLDIDLDGKPVLGEMPFQVDCPGEYSLSANPVDDSLDVRGAVEIEPDAPKDLGPGPVLDLPEASQDRQGEPGSAECRNEESRAGSQADRCDHPEARGGGQPLDLESDPRNRTAAEEADSRNDVRCDSGRVVVLQPQKNSIRLGIMGG
jgi:hypothetical protein